MKNKKAGLSGIIRKTVRSSPLLAAGLALSVGCSVAAALVPPLVLERIINSLGVSGNGILALALIYFAALALSGVSDAFKEIMITVFGQRITRGVRGGMCEKLSRLSADYFSKNEPGVTVSRFVNDVDTVETLFASGVIGMFVDACKIIGILAVIFVKSPGLGIMMLCITPLLFLFTRIVQKRMLKAEKQNRAAIGKVSGQVPETIKNIRMIHVLGLENYMSEKYERYINEGYRAVEKTNFYDAIYSPVILTVSAVIIGAMMSLAAGGGAMQTFFGMSVGTAVAVIAYVGKIFSPLESIGMEIQSIQSAAAGVSRIRELLSEPERSESFADVNAKELLATDMPAVSADNLCFSYDGNQPVLEHLSFAVSAGESVTLAGRTGAGKSTLFKLLLGLYSPVEGTVKIFGVSADKIPDNEKRSLFGCVEQSFRPVPGTVLDQITVFDSAITRSAAEAAARLSGIDKRICTLPDGYDTYYSDSLFSQGQRQLLAIARAVAANPGILLLDEITANLDSETESTVLAALESASEKRTVISISHRLYEKLGNRLIEI